MKNTVGAISLGMLAITVFYGTLCAQEAGQKNAINADVVIEKIMHSWLLINIARSIAIQDAAVLGHAIIAAMLEMHAIVYGFIYSEIPISANDTHKIYTALEGLQESHGAWCEVQQAHETICSRKIMSAVFALWASIH